MFYFVKSQMSQNQNYEVEQVVVIKLNIDAKFM